MNLVDSSAWLAIFANTKNASAFEGPILQTALLIVPTVVMYEVAKVLLREKSEDIAIRAQAHMQQGSVVALTSEIALEAAACSLKYKLPMADSIILTTARLHHATLWTQDRHFEGFPQVKYFEG